jgi:hypothetical protein
MGFPSGPSPSITLREEEGEEKGEEKQSKQ